jgi:hypothetical protein
MSFYSPSELQSKAEEIVEEAVAATYREAESYRQAVNAKYQQDYNAAGYEGEAPPGMMPIGPEQEAEFRSYVEGSFDYIPPSFESYTKPQPEPFDAIVTSFETVEGTFGGSDTSTRNSGLDFTDKAQAEIEEWEGFLSENLQNSLLIPFPSISANHGKIARSLRECMEATREIYNGQKRDISDIADKTIDALKECGTRDGSDAKLGLTVLAAVTAVVGIALTPVTGGASTAIGFGVAMSLQTIGSAGSITSITIPPDEEIQLGGETVNDVISNMFSAMSDLSTKVYEQEEKVIGVLEHNYDEIVKVRQHSNTTGESSQIMPLRPKLADSDDPSSGLAPE